MGANLPIQTETFQSAEDHSWLGSQHGTEATETITLRGADFVGTFTDGIIPSGTVIAAYTSTGQVGKGSVYADAGTSGRDTAVGHLLNTTDVGLAGADVVVALFTHGKVRVGKLKANNGLTTAARADLKDIRYLA